jgi:hypothetical protein
VEPEVKKCIFDFTLRTADGSPVYINGAAKAHGLKQKYDIRDQSLTFLYNIYSYYTKPDEEFFDYIFPNNSAIDFRILKLKFGGRLLEEFEDDINFEKIAEENKMYYIKVTKHLLWLKELKKTNSYERRFKTILSLELNGRKKKTFMQLTWLIDLYSRTQEEYNKFISLLEKAIVDYKLMLGEKVSYAKQETLSISDQKIDDSKQQQELTVEIEDNDKLAWDKNLLVWQYCVVCKENPCNMGTDGKPYCKEHLK